MPDAPTQRGCKVELLQDYVTLHEAARQLGCSKRTLERMRARGELPVSYFGVRPLLNIAKFREMLRAREMMVVTTGRRRRRK